MVVVVGTHRDEEEQMVEKGKCKETRTQKNRKLKNILLPWLLTMLIMFRPPDDIIFPVNMLNPNDDDKQVLRLLRQKIMESGLFSKFKIPVGWFMLEQDILTFAEEKKRKIVRISECEQIAANLKINDPEILEAALLYLHSLNVFLYCPKMLPGLVFTDPQVPLDCVFQLVALQFNMKGAIAGDAENLMNGIVTLKMMKSMQCFIPGYYEAEQAIKLFESLCIAASLGEGKYLMPFLLPVVQNTDLNKHIPTSSFPAPLLILFKNESKSITCVPNGVFCGVVAHLLSLVSDDSEDKWVISRDVNDDVECMARNLVKLSHRIPPAKITIVNMQVHFEVYLETDDSFLSDYCPELYQMMSGAVKHVLTTFNYSNSTPHPAFKCTCSDLPHAAEPVQYKGKIHLSCTKPSGKSAPMNEQHYIWKTVADKHPVSVPITATSAAVLQLPVQVPSEPAPYTGTGPMREKYSSPFAAGDISTATPSTGALPKLSDKPTIAQLQTLIGADGKTLKIIDHVAAKWSKIATSMDFDATGYTEDTIRANNEHDVTQCCKVTFKTWLEGKGSKQPSTWSMLIHILDKCDFKVLANDVKKALS